MMTLLWFDDKVSPYERKRVQLDLRQALASAPIKIKEVDVRATLELEQGPGNLHLCDARTCQSSARYI